MRAFNSSRMSAVDSFQWHVTSPTRTGLPQQRVRMKATSSNSSTLSQLIDTEDGAGVTPATTGSFLLMNAVVNDNDTPLVATEMVGFLWNPGQERCVSIYGAGEDSWPVGLRLTPGDLHRGIAVPPITNKAGESSPPSRRLTGRASPRRPVRALGKMTFPLYGGPPTAARARFGALLGRLRCGGESDLILLGVHSRWSSSRSCSSAWPRSLGAACSGWSRWAGSSSMPDHPAGAVVHVTESEVTVQVGGNT